MNKAVFLDRDGVINWERGTYIEKLTDFKVLPHAPGLIAELHRRGYLLIVITNQGGIARGLYTPAELAEMHAFMLREIEAAGGTLTAIYYCPHHPEHGSCICRKPDSLMIEKAIARYDIDVARSVFIGDKQRDMDAAEKAGVPGIMIPENTDWAFVLQNLR